MTVGLQLAAAWHVATGELLGVVASAIALSTIDDVAIDIAYALWPRSGRWRPRHEPAALLPAGVGWMAIVVPAWDEAGVIAAMLGDLTQRLDHEHYRVFVGTYPNDPATRAAVSTVCDPRISIVTVASPGPTTKADCLNHLWRAVVAHEVAAGIRFKAVVLHDAEDVVDPRELTVFDHLIPGYAMVQLPVIPLVDARSRWISGHYIDEFAEAHGKDIVVRGAIGAAVPSAGVACAIDREVLGALAGDGPTPFDPRSMTEDYELGMKVARAGGRGILFRIPGAAGGGAVATREHFPATFDTAIRQKTRWLMGIALSGWDRVGWCGGIADRYMLLRDRKAVVTPLLNLAGYAVAGMFAIDQLLAMAVPGAASFSPVVARGSLLTIVLWLTGAACGWRLCVRAGFTGATHGWREGLRAVPRALVGNGINAVAAWRALRRYYRIRAGAESPVWDKTAHRYPGVDPAA